MVVTKPREERPAGGGGGGGGGGHRWGETPREELRVGGWVRGV